nr:lysine-rich arabinogalactan protein 19-like [Aegilops tauschii subsp. strangulata]
MSLLLLTPVAPLQPVHAHPCVALLPPAMPSLALNRCPARRPRRPPPTAAPWLLQRSRLPYPCCPPPPPVAAPATPWTRTCLIVVPRLLVVAPLGTGIRPLAVRRCYARTSVLGRAPARQCAPMPHRTPLLPSPGLSRRCRPGAPLAVALAAAAGIPAPFTGVGGRPNGRMPAAPDPLGLCPPTGAR